VQSVFEGFGHVRDVAGNDEQVAGPKVEYLGFAVGVERETHRSRDDRGKLLVVVDMGGNDAALLEMDVGDGSLLAGDELAFQQGVEFFEGDIGPADKRRGSSHADRVQPGATILHWGEGCVW